MLAAIHRLAFRPGDRHMRARLDEPQLRIPELEVFVVVADKHQETEVGQRSIVGHGWAPF